MLKKWLGKEKRQHPRTQVEPPSLDSFSVTLETSGRESLSCQVRDLSISRVLVSVPPEECPRFESGDKIKLTVAVAQLQETILLNAVVTECTSGAGTTDITLIFEDPSRFADRLDPVHLSFLNSRQSYRVEMADSRYHTEVSIVWDGGRAVGWINDLSLSGMGLGVEPEVAQLLTDTARLELTFSLHGTEATLCLVGRIRYQRPAGRNFHCGILFDQDRSADYQQQERIIASYLTCLQQEQLKMIANR
jgi:hypothetical protein